MSDQPATKSDVALAAIIVVLVVYCITVVVGSTLGSKLDSLEQQIQQLKK